MTSEISLALHRAALRRGASQAPTAGELNRRVTIETPTIVREGSYGGETMSEPWPVLATVWARVTDLVSEENQTGGARLGSRRVVFRIRWRSDITNKMRIGHAGRKFRIDGDPLEVGQKEALDINAIAYGI